MKKKIYLVPETLVVELELQRMIALSTLGDANPDGEVLSRGDDFFEEEEELDPSRRSKKAWDDEEEFEDQGGW